VLRLSRSAAQILQNGPDQLGLLGCAPCSRSGGPFWPLSSPNPPKRTSPAWSAWLCSLLSLYCTILAPNHSKQTSPAWSAWLLALPLVVRFGRSAGQFLQNGLRQLGQVDCAPCLSVLAAQQLSKLTQPFHWLQVQGGVETSTFRLKALPSAD